MVFTDLDPNLSREQISLKEEVHRFAAEVMRPIEKTQEENHENKSEWNRNQLPDVGRR